MWLMSMSARRQDLLKLGSKFILLTGLPRALDYVSSHIKCPVSICSMADQINTKAPMCWRDPVPQHRTVVFLVFTWCGNLCELSQGSLRISLLSGFSIWERTLEHLLLCYFKKELCYAYQNVGSLGLRQNCGLSPLCPPSTPLSQSSTGTLQSLQGLTSWYLCPGNHAGR